MVFILRFFFSSVLSLAVLTVTEGMPNLLLFIPSLCINFTLRLPNTFAVGKFLEMLLKIWKLTNNFSFLLSLKRSNTSTKYGHCQNLDVSRPYSEAMSFFYHNKIKCFDIKENELKFVMFTIKFKIIESRITVSVSNSWHNVKFLFTCNSLPEIGSV